RLKLDVLRETLDRSGVAWDASPQIHRSPEQGWRMRASFHLQTRAGGVALGLRQEGTHRVVDLERCLQVSAGMNEAYRAFARGFGARPELAKRVRDVDVLESPDLRQRVAVLDGDLEARDTPPLLALAERVPQLTGLGVMIGRAGRRRFVSLRGEPHV